CSDHINEGDELPNVYRLDRAFERNGELLCHPWMRHLVVGTAAAGSLTQDAKLPAHGFHVTNRPVARRILPHPFETLAHGHAPDRSLPPDWITSNCCESICDMSTERHRACGQLFL